MDSHSQLTPSLLIGILESLTSTRLSISEEQRTSSSTTAKVHCMKIFLGILQSDILKQDVGIGNLDPRRLAGGADEETIYVARLLCWYGRRKHLISRGDAGADARNDSGSPSTLTTAPTRVETSPLSTGFHPESDTSVSSSAFFPSPAHAHGVVTGPRCIHEVPSPSLVLSPASNLGDLDSSLFAREARPGDDVESALFSQTHTQAQESTVRYQGYISVVDEEAEIAAFEAREAAKRRRRAKGKGRQMSDATTPDGHAPRDEDESQTTHISASAKRRSRMELLQLKADMLEELARLRISEYEDLRGGETQRT